MLRTMERISLACFLFSSACTHASTPAPQPRASLDPTALEVVERTALRAILQEEGVSGTIALLREEEREVVCSDVVLCQQRVLPASTFKIANALIGLETGVIADADFVIPWDGVQREFADWNRDHTLRSAIAASAVPYFQELSRRVGAAREAHWTRALVYGNGDTGSAARVDEFWLEGPLAISAVEQVSFLRRFARGELPVSSRSLAVVRAILVLAEHDGTVLRGKTGWARPHQRDQHGWFVGFVERGHERAYVAVLVRPGPGQDDASFLSARRRVAEHALSSLSAW